MVNVETVPAAHQKKSAGGLGVFIGLAPWVLFTVVAQHGTLKIASVVALVAAVGIAGRSILSGSPKLLELAAVVSFMAFTAVAFAADPSVGHFVERYARAIAAGLLAAIAWASVATVPFTEQYARGQVPKQYWSSPRFRAVNLKMSTTWALVFTAMVPCHIAAGLINTSGTNIILNWVIPIILVLEGSRRSSPPAAEKAQS